MHWIQSSAPCTADSPLVQWAANELTGPNFTRRGGCGGWWGVRGVGGGCVGGGVGGGGGGLGGGGGGMARGIAETHGKQRSTARNMRIGQRNLIAIRERQEGVCKPLKRVADRASSVLVDDLLRHQQHSRGTGQPMFIHPGDRPAPYEGLGSISVAAKPPQHTAGKEHRWRGSK